MKIYIFVTLILLSLSNANAAIEERNVTAKGQGESRQSALMQALSNAAGQAFGIELSSETVSSSVGTSIDTDEMSTSVFVDALSQVVRETVKSDDSQPITGYRVLSDLKLNEGGWQVEVELSYATYGPLGQVSTRRTVAVVSRDSNYEFLRELVEKALVSSRRFDVISRRDQHLFEDEKAFIRGEDAGRLEIARLGGAQGADYLVIVDVKSWERSFNRESFLTSTGETVLDSYFDVQFGIDVVEFSTREVKWTNAYRVSRSTDERVSNGDGWIFQSVEPAIRSGVDELISTIYPMQVISVEQNTFLVNRGSQYIKGNERFSVFSEGKPLIDPETGESLGVSEQLVGTAEVVEVFPKYSRLRLLDGQMLADDNYSVRRTEQTQVVHSESNRSMTTPQETGTTSLEKKRSTFLN